MQLVTFIFRLNGLPFEVIRFCYLWAVCVVCFACNSTSPEAQDARNAIFKVKMTDAPLAGSWFIFPEYYNEDGSFEVSSAIYHGGGEAAFFNTDGTGFVKSRDKIDDFTWTLNNRLLRISYTKSDSFHTFGDSVYYAYFINDKKENRMEWRITSPSKTHAFSLYHYYQ